MIDRVRGKSSQYLMRVFFLLFVLSVTVPVISCSYIPNYGLFGELRSSVIGSEDQEEVSEVSSRIAIRKKQKGKNIFNIWLYILVCIICVRLFSHSFPLLREDTIVTKKVRMND